MEAIIIVPPYCNHAFTWPLDGELWGVGRQVMFW